MIWSNRKLSVSSKPFFVPAFEKSFVIVDEMNTYHVTAYNSTKLFDKKHNMTDPIEFFNAQTYEKGFDVIYGSCSSKFVGYFRILANVNSFGVVPIGTFGRYSNVIYFKMRFSTMNYFKFFLFGRKHNGRL